MGAFRNALTIAVDSLANMAGESALMTPPGGSPTSIVVTRGQTPFAESDVDGIGATIRAVTFHVTVAAYETAFGAGAEPAENELIDIGGDRYQCKPPATGTPAVEHDSQRVVFYLHCKKIGATP